MLNLKINGSTRPGPRARGTIERDLPDIPRTLDLVGPSGFVKAVMGPMTKALNPLISKLARRRHSRMAAQIHHVGRSSGRPYITPVAGRVHGDVVLIPLTFGSRSDWSRNVRAAGGCTIRFEGKDYHAAQPVFLTVEQAKPLVRAAFSAFERASFRMLGIRQVMRLQVMPAGGPGRPE